MRSTLARVLTASVLIATCALAPADVFAAPAAERAIVQDVDLANFPHVRLEVVVPASLIEQGRPVFSVEENGRTVEVLKASVRKVDQPIDAVLVLDTSGSMKGRSLEAAKSAAKAFIAELQASSRASVVVFSDKPKVLVSTTGDAAALSNAIDSIEARGETSLYDAVRVGLRQVKRGGDTRPVVVVLSDGADTVSRASLTSTLSEIRSAGTPLLAVTLPSKEADFESLRLMAQASGGRVSSVSDLGALTGYYRGLARELQTRYTVVYSSNRPSTMDLDISVRASSASAVAAGGIVVKNPSAAYEGPLTKTLDPVPPANLLTYALAILLVFGSVALLIIALALLLIRPSTGLEKLAYYDQADQSLEVGGGTGDRVMGGVINAVDFVAGKGGFKRLAHEQLDRAGLPLRPTEYIGMHLALVVAVGSVTGLLSHGLVLPLLVVVAATALPLAWLSHRITQRRTQFEAQLPDTLDLLAGSLRAGWGLQQALEAVVEQSKPPMSDEFRRAQTEVRLGRTVEDSLESVAQRIQSTDFDWVVSAIAVQREVGGNLAELLSIVANTIRDRGALKRHIGALTSEGRLSAIILFALPFFEALVLFVVNRGYVSKLVTTGPGLMMLATGAMLLVIGGVWLRRVIKVEV